MRARQDGEGWVFYNPDSGEEYSRDHPIKSGETPYAENVRRSTTMEDVLWQEVQRLFQKHEAGAHRSDHEQG